MSRCTPTSNVSWNRRLKRYGGLEGLAAERTKQFKLLEEGQAAALQVIEAARVKEMYSVCGLSDLDKHQLKKATNFLDDAKCAYEILIGNARRVLPLEAQKDLGWR